MAKRKPKDRFDLAQASNRRAITAMVNLKLANERDRIVNDFMTEVERRFEAAKSRGVVYNIGDIEYSIDDLPDPPGLPEAEN